MEFEWHERKRRQNVQNHGIDFVDAQLIFDGRPVVTSPSFRQGERRYASIGYVNGKCMTVIWTVRGQNIRIISARRARDNEQRIHHEIHG